MNQKDIPRRYSNITNTKAAMLAFEIDEYLSL